MSLDRDEPGWGVVRSVAVSPGRDPGLVSAYVAGTAWLLQLCTST